MGDGLIFSLVINAPKKAGNAGNSKGARLFAPKVHFLSWRGGFGDGVRPAHVLMAVVGLFVLLGTGGRCFLQSVGQRLACCCTLMTTSSS